MGFQQMGFDDLAKQLEELGEIDQYAPELLKAAAPTLEKSMKEEVGKASDRGYATGELKEALKANKPGQNSYGHYVSVTAKGTDRKGVKNNEKLAYLNYGTSKQQARPVISKAVKNAEKECLQVMQETFNEVVK